VDFTSGQAQNIATTFCQTLEQVLNSPSTFVSDINPFSDHHFRQIQKWNSTPLDNVERCIHEIIKDQALSQPEKTAIVAWDKTFTYAELDDASSKLASHLVRLGLCVEDRVPLCFDKSVWNVVAMLAVMKAGGAFVPLDPTHPVSRLKSLVSRIGGKLVLCSKSHAEMLASVVDLVLPVDHDFIHGLEVSADETRVMVNCRNAAYVIYTSGSTGEPKGTILEHRAFCSSAAAHADALLIKPSSRMLQFAAHTFDSSLVETLTTLMVGATVCIPSEDARLNDITGAVNDMQVTVAILTPSFVQFLEPSQLPTLKGLVLAGEAMSQAHIEKWVDYVQLGNGYGPTECAVCSVANPNVTRFTEPTDIGNAVGVHCWITDPVDHNRLVPIGCIGELVIEGNTLARGYMNDPQKTADAFIENPAWAHVDNSTRRMYKTGDLVRYNWDGSLKFIGRKDTQVKVHGQRVELGEIENQLTTDPAINHALVFFPNSGLCQKRLVTIFTLSGLVQDGTGTEMKVVDGKLKDDASSRVASARNLLGKKIPAYMVPAIWINVEALPLLTSGKLDRKQVAKWLSEIDEELFNKVWPLDSSGLARLTFLI
jgi:amino acid adenylation domain-containing protein